LGPGAGFDFHRENISLSLRVHRAVLKRENEGISVLYLLFVYNGISIEMSFLREEAAASVQAAAAASLILTMCAITLSPLMYAYL